MDKAKQNNKYPLLSRKYQRYEPIYPKKKFMNNKSFQELPGSCAGPEMHSVCSEQWALSLLG